MVMLSLSLTNLKNYILPVCVFVECSKSGSVAMCGGGVRVSGWWGGGLEGDERNWVQVFDENIELLPSFIFSFTLYVYMQTYICSVEFSFVGILKFYLHNEAFSVTEKWERERKKTFSLLKSLKSKYT